MNGYYHRDLRNHPPRYADKEKPFYGLRSDHMHWAGELLRKITASILEKELDSSSEVYYNSATYSLNEKYAYEYRSLQPK